VRCLIVDDNPEFLEAARDVLAREGVEVLGVAENAAQAVASAALLRPDVILLDVYLGKESGLEVAFQLTEIDGAASPAIILISTYAERDLAELLADSPVVAFLPKDKLSGDAIRFALRRAKDQ
jgi:DNA-binding NarL/FixJ family response regulator